MDSLATPPSTPSSRPQGKSLGTSLRRRPRGKPAAHLRITAIAAIVWNSFGAIDYTLTELGHAEYLAQFTTEQVEYFSSFPLWVDIGWALGVGGAIVGSVLLLFRKGYAVEAFALSLLGFAVTDVYQYVWAYEHLFRMFSVFDVIVFPMIIYAIAVALFVYAWRMRIRGWLQ